MDAIFKALADPYRRQLLDRLYMINGQTLGELCSGLDISRQAVTKHLLILEKANLIATQKYGREKRHFLNTVPIYDISICWINKFMHEHMYALTEKENMTADI